jgi:hypothetical protein
LGDWFALKNYFLTSQASPNDQEIIVIVVRIIIVCEAQPIFHMGGIIAQTLYLGAVFALRENNQPEMAAKIMPTAMLMNRKNILKLWR